MIENARDIVLVDIFDNAIGQGLKLDVHKKGLLHRAFSVFIINEKNEMLLQKRAESKYHSAGLWSNACCSHPDISNCLTEFASKRLFHEWALAQNWKKYFHSYIGKNLVTYYMSMNIIMCYLDTTLVGSFMNNDTSLKSVFWFSFKPKT